MFFIYLFIFFRPFLSLFSKLVISRVGVGGYIQGGLCPGGDNVGCVCVCAGIMYRRDFVPQLVTSAKNEVAAI